MKQFVMTVCLILLWSPALLAMEHYTEPLQDEFGRAISGATVTVTQSGTGGLATIYSNNSGTVKANPFTTAADGVYDFYAPSGVYDITFSHPRKTFFPDKTKRIALFDPFDSSLVTPILLTDTVFAIADSDRGKLLSFCNGTTPINVTLPAPSGTAFNARWVLYVQNRCSETVTITSTALIDEATSLVLNEGNGVLLVSTGTRYVTQRGMGVGGGGGGGTNLPAQTIFTSESSPLKVCGLASLADDCYYTFVHSNGTPTIICVINGVVGDCDINVKIDAGNKWCLRDSANAIIQCVEPGASGMHNVYTFGPNYRQRKSITLSADAFYMHGCTLTTNTALVTGGLVEPYITCGDNDTHGFHRSFGMRDSWDGGPFTATLRLANVNAAPANVYEVDFSAECEANSDVMGASISSTGEQPATVNFANAGSCGTACAQFDVVKVTTAPITPNGGSSCAGGNLFRFQGNLDATATTTAQVADVKIIDVTIEYSVLSGSD